MTVDQTNVSKSAVKFLSLNRLPARLTPEQVAPVLGFKEHDIPILVRQKLLTPLGNPVANAVKYFSAMDVEARAQDQSWLNKATKATYRYWAERKAKRAPQVGDSVVSCN